MYLFMYIVHSYVKKEESKQWSLHEMHLNLRADLEKNLAFDLIMFSKLRVVSMEKSA